MELKNLFEQQPPYYEILLNSDVLKLGYSLLTKHSLNEKDGKSPANVNNLLKYNASYFSRRFHQYTGFTFVEYLNRCRTSLAAQMLLESEKTVSEIAMDCGFPNMSFFSPSLKGSIR